jgi:hypothetical protein
MQKTTISSGRLESKKTVDTVGLQAMLSCGRKSAVDIGNAAGARIQVGRRVLWNVGKVQKYLDAISE